MGNNNFDTRLRIDRHVFSERRVAAYTEVLGVGYHADKETGDDDPNTGYVECSIPQASRIF